MYYTILFYTNIHLKQGEGLSRPKIKRKRNINGNRLYRLGIYASLF